MKLVEDDTKHEGNNPEHNAVSTAGPSKEVRLNFCLFLNEIVDFIIVRISSRWQK